MIGSLHNNCVNFAFKPKMVQEIMIIISCRGCFCYYLSIFYLSIYLSKYLPPISLSTHHGPIHPNHSFYFECQDREEEGNCLHKMQQRLQKYWRWNKIRMQIIKGRGTERVEAALVEATFLGLWKERGGRTGWTPTRISPNFMGFDLGFYGVMINNILWWFWHGAEQVLRKEHGSETF